MVTGNTKLSSPHVEIIEISRPGKGNALSRAFLRRLTQRVEAARRSTILLLGTGPSFSTGLDLDEIFEAGSAHEHLALYINLLRTIDRHLCSTMSAVNGRAIGGGAALALCTDVVIAKRTASFELPEDDRFKPLADVPKTVVRARRMAGAYSAWANGKFKLTADQAQECRLIDRCVSESQWRQAVSDPLALLESVTDREERRNVRLRDAEVWTDVEGLLQSAAKPEATVKLIEALREKAASKRDP